VSLVEGNNVLLENPVARSIARRLSEIKSVQAIGDHCESSGVLDAQQLRELLDCEKALLVEQFLER